VPPEVARKSTVVVEPESRIDRVHASGLRPVTRIIRQQNGVTGCLRVRTGESLKAQYVFDVVISTQILCCVIGQSKLFVRGAAANRPCLVFQLHGNAAVATRSEQIEAEYTRVHLDWNLKTNRQLWIPSLEQPGESMLEVGFRMKDGAFSGEVGKKTVDQEHGQSHTETAIRRALRRSQVSTKFVSPARRQQSSRACASEPHP
jgi:hypothetical protein